MAKQRMAIYFGDKLNSGDYDNGVWMDILGIPFLSSIDEAGNYDIIIRTLWLESTIQGWSKEIRARFPAVKQIGLTDHPLSTHISKMPANNQVSYIADLQYLDGIMALTEEEKEWYQMAVPSIPVVKTGLPFPFESYESKYGKFRGSEKKFIGLGVGAVDNDRNFISSWIVFRALQLIHPDIQGVFLSIPPTLIQYCNTLSHISKNVFIHERSDMNDYYDILSQCKFVINLADRNTPGRIQAEGAFFGVPVIGSNRLELQNELYPSLAVKPYELEKATGLANLLLEDPQYGDLVASKAVGMLQRYNYKSSKRKFNKLLKEVLERG